jgi:hypothetical protein
MVLFVFQVVTIRPRKERNSSMLRILKFSVIALLLLQINCISTKEKSTDKQVTQKIGFEVGQKVYVNSASGLIIREAPSKSSPKKGFLHYGVPVIITNMNYQEDLVDGKYKGYWLQKEKGGWFFSYFVSITPIESNVKAEFNRLLSEFEEFKNLDESNIELSGDTYSYYYQSQSHIHPEFRSITFNGNESVEYMLETWSGFGTYAESTSNYLVKCTLDRDLIKRRLKFILEIKSDEAMSGKPSFKRNSIKGFWAKVCNTMPR